MNYGFLIGLLGLAFIMGTVGFISAGRERDRARARLKLAKGTLPSAANGKRSASLGSLAMLQAMATNHPEKFPANQPLSRAPSAAAVGGVYRKLWQRAKA